MLTKIISAFSLIHCRNALFWQTNYLPFIGWHILSIHLIDRVGEEAFTVCPDFAWVRQAEMGCD